MEDGSVRMSADVGETCFAVTDTLVAHMRENEARFCAKQ